LSVFTCKLVETFFLSYFLAVSSKIFEIFLAVRNVNDFKNRQQIYRCADMQRAFNI